MSTLDPIESRRSRDAARRGSKPSATLLVTGLVVIFIGGVLELRSIYGFAEFDGTGAQPPVAIFMQILGLPAILLGLLMSVGGARRLTGRLAAAPVVSPGTVLFGGFAAGAWWGRSLLADAPTVLSALPAGLTVLAGSCWWRESVTGFVGGPTAASSPS